MSQTYSGSYRAAVIGHTGRGNYGHGLDIVFVGMPRVETVAVADADAEGCERTAARIGAPRAYRDYREMLATERPDIVSVAPRHPDQREAMVVAAAQARVKAIYCEKPFARSLDEADRMLEACAAHDVKVAIAHQLRVYPVIQQARQDIAAGAIGRLRAINAYGKCDHRGGGQDLMVLGTHMLDLMRLFAGGPLWCHSRICLDGRDVTAADVQQGEENIGPIAGDDIVATYGFGGGVTGAFSSMRSADGGGNDYFRIELSGTAGTLNLWANAAKPMLRAARPFGVPGPGEWEAVSVELLPMPNSAPPGAIVTHPYNQALVHDLLSSVETGGEPIASGADGRAAVEMIMAVYTAHVHGARVGLPLARRTHPLSHWPD